MIKRIFTFILMIICILYFILNAYAITETGSIVVCDASCNAGDIVEVKIDLNNNTGIVALKISISYDNTKLTLVNAVNGDIFNSNTALFGNDLTQVPYSMIWEDSLSQVNYNKDGNLASLYFKIQDDAEAGDTLITLQYDKGSTFNSNLNYVEFELASGVLTINNDCSHDFRKWITVTQATCELDGLTVNECINCSIIFKQEVISAYGHNYSDWIVEIPATVDKWGKKYRFCLNTGCTKKEYNDISRLTFEEIEIKNGVDIIIDGKYIYVFSEKKLLDFLDCFINKEIVMYNNNEILLSDNDMVGTGALMVLNKNGVRAADYITILLGDVNGNGSVSVSDARSTLRAAIKLDVLNEWQSFAADINSDGIITTYDARSVLRVAIGIDSFFLGI